MLTSCFRLWNSHTRGFLLAMIFSLAPSICSSRRKDATTLVNIAVSCSSYPICLEAIAALDCTLYSLSHLISILYHVLTSKPCWHYVSSVASRTRTVSVTSSPDVWSLAVVQRSLLCRAWNAPCLSTFESLLEFQILLVKLLIFRFGFV